MKTPAADAHDAMYIAGLIKPKLAGLGPDVQGAILAELVSILFAGMHPDMREEHIEIWIKAMRDLIEINAQGQW